VLVAVYESGPDAFVRSPRVWTGSRIHGRIIWNGSPVSFDLRQAKGAPRNEKWLRFSGRDGRVVREISLTETGWCAHGRVIKELLQPAPDMRHSLADAAAVMEVVDESRALACEQHAYTFGELPAFLAPC